MYRQRKGMDTPIPFGPFLAAAGWLFLLVGHQTVDRYLALYAHPRLSAAMRGGFRIGLTGGIACGKTTVANLFAALGVPIVDTDLLAREVVAPGSPLLAPDRRRNSARRCSSSDGSLDRRELRTRVFADPARAHVARAAHASGHPRAHRRALRRGRRART